MKNVIKYIDNQRGHMLDTYKVVFVFLIIAIILAVSLGIVERFWGKEGELMYLDISAIISVSILSVIGIAMYFDKRKKSAQ